MHWIILFIISLLPIIYSKHDNNWAVLVAGSNEFWNYRHQADIFHSYHILIEKGFNPAHIILFAYDDIAYDKENPIQGEIFHTPDGEDVYKGVIIDYKGDDVNPTNYLKVIKGDKEGMKGIGSGRVLESTSEDNVFMYLVDHGSDGMFYFPKHRLLYSDHLIKALTEMHSNKMYHQLVFYLESCHSGSMFETIPSDLNIYVTTASTPIQSSYAIHCHLMIRDLYFGFCLADEYSINWMVDTEMLQITESYTLHDQYEKVKSLTKKSRPMEYGDLSIGVKGQVNDFLFDLTKKDHEGRQRKKKMLLRHYDEGERISSRDVKIEYLKGKIESNDGENYIEMYNKEVEMIARSRMIFDLFKRELQIPDRRLSKMIDYNCLRFTIEIYKDKCGFDERDMEYVHLFTTACSMKIKLMQIYSTINTICKTI